MLNIKKMRGKITLGGMGFDEMTFKEIDKMKGIWRNFFDEMAFDKLAFDEITLDEMTFYEVIYIFKQEQYLPEYE
jgi:hypothetical protein